MSVNNGIPVPQKTREILSIMSNREAKILWVAADNDQALSIYKQLGDPKYVQMITPGRMICAQGFEEIIVEGNVMRDHGGLREWLDDIRCRLMVGGRMRFLS